MTCPPGRRRVPNDAHPQLVSDDALDLLKRHSGTDWDPGWFAGLLGGGSVRGSRNPLPPPISWGASRRVIPDCGWEPRIVVLTFYSVSENGGAYFLY